MWVINSSSYINMKFVRNGEHKKGAGSQTARELCYMQVILHQQQGRVNVPTNGEALKVCFVDARRLCAWKASYTMHFIKRVVRS